jgi:hypothetical protein
VKLSEIEVGAYYVANLDRYRSRAWRAGLLLNRANEEPWRYQVTEQDRADAKFTRLPYFVGTDRQDILALRVQALATGVQYGKTKQGVEVEWTYQVTVTMPCPTCHQPWVEEIGGEPVTETHAASAVVHPSALGERWEAYEVERALQHQKWRESNPWYQRCEDVACPHLLLEGEHNLGVCQPDLRDRIMAERAEQAEREQTG